MRWQVKFTFLIGLLLPSCQAYVVRSTADENSPYYSVPVGAVLVLHQPLVIAPTYARIYFQNGQVAPAINEFIPHCQLQVRQVLPVPQSVYPDEFTIVRVSYGVIEMAAIPGLQWAHGVGGGTSDIMKVQRLRLHSKTQPDVLNLICAGALDTPLLARPPSVSEMRAALGSYAGLRLRY